MGIIKASYHFALRFYSVFTELKITERAAALAYYALFAFSPVLVLIIASADLFEWGSYIYDGIRAFLVQSFGSESRTFLDNVIKTTENSSASLFVTSVSILLVLYGAVNFFRAIRTSLSDVFSVTPKKISPFVGHIIMYASSFAYLLFFLSFVASLLIAQVVLHLGIQGVEEFFDYRLSLFSTRLISTLVPFLLLVFFFTTTYFLFSSRSLRVGDALLGGLVAGSGALVLNIFLGIYFSLSSAFVVYGTAGFIVAMLLWVYFFSLILFSGAIVAKYSSKT